MADGLGGAACRAAGYRGPVLACAVHPRTSGTGHCGGACGARPGANGARGYALTEPGADFDPGANPANARAARAGAAAQCAARANAAATAPAAGACGRAHARAAKPGTVNAARAGPCTKP